MNTLTPVSRYGAGSSPLPSRERGSHCKELNMPVIDHSTQRLSEPTDKVSSRGMITEEHGAESLSIREIVIEPGYRGRLHTHDTDEAVMVVEGSIQFIVGDEVRTVRSGYSMLAPPGVAHKLVNNTWVSARMLVIRPTTEQSTTHLE